MPACAAVNCTNRHPFRTFRFPQNLERRIKWWKNTRRDKWFPTVRARLCEVHFADDQFENHRADGLRKLKPNAVPTIFNFPDRPKKRNKTPSNEASNTPEQPTTSAHPPHTFIGWGHEVRGEQDQLQTSHDPYQRATLEHQPTPPVSLPPATSASPLLSLISVTNDEPDNETDGAGSSEHFQTVDEPDRSSTPGPTPPVPANPPHGFTGLERHKSFGSYGHFQELESLREENETLREERASSFKEIISLREENEFLKQELAAIKEKLSGFLDEEKQDAVALGKALVKSWSRDPSVDGYKIGFALGLYPDRTSDQSA